MERSWGKEAMKFARTEIPALLNGYTGKPESFFSALDKRWKDRCKVLKKRIEELEQDDDPESTALAADLAKQEALAERTQHEAKAKAAKASKAKAAEADKADGDGDSDAPKK